MVQPNHTPIFDQNRRENCIETPNSHTTNGVGLIFNNPHIVLVFVRVQSDLLLLGAGRVHMTVRMEVSTLGVVMSDGDAGAVCDVRGNTVHALRVESGLEL